MKPQTLKRTLNNLGLELVAFDGNFANGSNIRIKAPDGTIGKFTISRLDDPHSDKINVNQFRHFAKDHSEAEVLNLTPKPVTCMEAAVQATVLEHDLDTEKYAKRVYRKKPLLNPVGMLLSGASEPYVEPPAPKPTQLEIEMPKLTLANPSPEKTKRKSIDRIGQVQFFKLCTVLNDIDMIGIDSLPKLAEKLTKAYGSKVGPTTARDALEATGRKLDKVQVEVTDAQVVIARTLTALLIKLSEDVPPELRRLCGDIE